jgi:hypothetical protein
VERGCWIEVKSRGLLTSIQIPRQRIKHKAQRIKLKHRAQSIKNKDGIRYADKYMKSFNQTLKNKAIGLFFNQLYSLCFVLYSLNDYKKNK